MNQKKAKALRRECSEFPRMIQIIPTQDVTITERNRKTGATRRVKRNPLEGYKQRVNHYRNAKKLYRGSIRQAVRAAIRHAGVMESIGVYKFK